MKRDGTTLRHIIEHLDDLYLGYAALGKQERAVARRFGCPSGTKHGNKQFQHISLRSTPIEQFSLIETRTSPGRRKSTGATYKNVVNIERPSVSRMMPVLLRADSCNVVARSTAAHPTPTRQY